MNHKTLIRLAIAASLAWPAVAVFGNDKPEAAAPPADETRQVVDLRKPPTGLAGYGSWQDKISTSASGVIVLGSKGADGKGGLGGELAPALDLSHDTFVEVALGLGGSNAVPDITVAFSDADEIQYTATIHVDEVVPGQPVWLRVRLADFKLNDWQGKHAGRKIDWTRIVHWDLQGDWKTEAPMHVVFIAVRVRK
jgi:hypothetical protein